VLGAAGRSWASVAVPDSLSDAQMAEIETHNGRST